MQISGNRTEPSLVSKLHANEDEKIEDTNASWDALQCQKGMQMFRGAVREILLRSVAFSFVIVGKSL